MNAIVLLLCGVFLTGGTLSSIKLTSVSSDPELLSRMAYDRFLEDRLDDEALEELDGDRGNLEPGAKNPLTFSESLSALRSKKEAALRHAALSLPGKLVYAATSLYIQNAVYLEKLGLLGITTSAEDQETVIQKLSRMGGSSEGRKLIDKQLPTTFEDKLASQTAIFDSKTPLFDVDMRKVYKQAIKEGRKQMQQKTQKI